MNQEVFIVFPEKRREPETTRILAVFATEDLAVAYIDRIKENQYFHMRYNYYIFNEVLRTVLPV